MPILHRRSIRLPEYDYTQPGYYFLTLVTYHRINRFGVIDSMGMHVNAIGKMVQNEWQRLPQRFPGVALDAHMVMPNHFHGILCIAVDPVKSGNAQSFEGFGHPVKASIPTMVRSFKASVTLRSRRITGDPEVIIWQSNYFERVIRNERGLLAARLYIEENPVNWAEDLENPNRRKA